MTITFLGGAGTVTGSKYLVTYGDRRILVDAGLFQGDKHLRLLNWEKFPVPAATITDVLITHAHLDHVGYLPRLVKQGFHGRIWATQYTIELAEIVLRDAGYLQERDVEHAQLRGYSKHAQPEALYTTQDVERTLPLFRSIDYDTDLDLGDGISARYTRAGHILGAAAIRVWTGENDVLFSGDLGRVEHPILRAREIPDGAAMVLIESTYGDREHPEPASGGRHEELADAIRRTIDRGGTVLIPAFAVDRTELVLHALGEMRHEGRIPDVPIYVNSPMGIRALRVYQDSEHELRDDLDAHEFVDLTNVHEALSQEDSIKLNNPTSPCIIISSSGMATGGRVVHHLQKMLPDPRNTVVFTGYQAQGTRGRDLVEGAQHLKMYGEYVRVKAEIVQDEEFSVHADASELIDWLQALDPQPRVVFLVHGEERASTALADKLTDLGYLAVSPRYGEVVRVPNR